MRIGVSKVTKLDGWCPFDAYLKFNVRASQIPTEIVGVLHILKGEFLVASIKL